MAQNQATQNSANVQGSSTHSEKRWEKAPNRWQHTAVDLAKQTDTVTLDVRARRKSFWLDEPMNSMIMHQALGGTQALGLNQYTFDNFGDSPELPPDTAADPLPSIWAIAIFESFHVYAFDADEKLLYTELNLRIDTVIRKPENMHLASGDLVDVFRFGGTAKTHTGAIVTSRNLSPAKYDLQLGHKYLVRLLPEVNNGGFFTLSSRWDLTSGRVQPDDPYEVDRAVRGESKLAGMTVSDLIKYLQTALPAVPKK